MTALEILLITLWIFEISGQKGFRKNESEEEQQPDEMHLPFMMQCTAWKLKLEALC